MLLHDYCAIHDFPATPLLYAIHHTLLVVAIGLRVNPLTRLSWDARWQALDAAEGNPRVNP